MGHRRKATPSEMARRAAIERVLPGFPAQPFDSLEDVQAHVGGNVLTCLMCGKSYEAVILHVRRTRDMSESEYRLRFNIPTCFSLAGKRLSELRTEVATRPEHIEHIRQQRVPTPITGPMTELGARYRCEKIWAARRSVG